MYRPIILTLAVVGVFLAQGGCIGNPRKWELSAENRGNSPCSIAILYGEDASRSARVDSLPKGPPQVLVAENVDTPLRSVTVKTGSEEQVLHPNLRMIAGKRYTVVIDDTGVTIATADQ